MPNLTPEQIQELVNGEKISALTLDTSIFDRFGCNLSYRFLAALAQFKGTGVKVLFSEVTLGEVEAHIARDAAAASEKARASINQFIKSWRSDVDRADIEARLGVGADPRARAKQLVDAYCDVVRAEIVPVEPGVSVAELVRRYFSAEPPFQDKDGKKSEFPDAIALLSLETWAKAHEGMVLVVSQDGDWQRFCDGSELLVCVKELPQSLSFFNTASGVLVARAFSEVREGRAPHLRASVDAALESFLAEFEIEYASDHFAEAEAEDMSVLSWRIQEGREAQAVASDEETVTFDLDLEVEARFSAGFRFAIWDSVDKEYIPLASATAVTEQMLDLQVAVTIYRDEHEDPTPFEVEVESRSVTVDFGYVEPDWGEGPD